MPKDNYILQSWLTTSLAIAIDAYKDSLPLGFGQYILRGHIERIDMTLRTIKGEINPQPKSVQQIINDYR